MSVTQRFHLDKLADEDEASEFIAWCCVQIGTCFHPDTPFSDYEAADGTKVFSKEAVDQYESLMKQAYELLGDPCEIAMRMPPFASAGDAS